MVAFSSQFLIRSKLHRNLRRVSLFSVLLLSLASCITPNIEDWPQTIPSQQLFIEVYDEDEENSRRQSQAEYLEWLLSFYQGSLTYQSGWQDIRGDVFEADDTEARAELLVQIRDLGIAIGSEWAKHNDLRLIDSRMLSLWGSTIQLAPDFEAQRDTVEVIAEDVENLLSGSLESEDIHERRYSTILGIELFEGF